MKSTHVSAIALGLSLLAMTSVSSAASAKVISGTSIAQLKSSKGAVFDGVGTDIYVYNHSSYFVQAVIPSMDVEYEVAPNTVVDFHDDFYRDGATVYLAYDFEPYNYVHVFVENGGVADVWEPDFMAAKSHAMMASPAKPHAKVKFSVRKA